MSRLWIIPAALLAMVAAALVWSGGGSSRPADFVFINRGEVSVLDPNRMSWLHEIRMGYALWEGLYTLDPATLDPIPGTADPIDISSDKTVYTFHIRPTARWSNGDSVVAADFAFAWRRMLEEPGDYTYLLHNIRGAKTYQDDFAAGRHADFARVGIEVIAPDVLRVTLVHPVAYFPQLCAFPAFFPLHEKSMRPFAQPADPRTGRVTYRAGFTRPPYLVTNGAFRLASWDFKRRMRLEASDYYWDRAHVKSRSVEMLVADDPMWSFLKYDSGAADWAPEVVGTVAAELKAQQRKDLHVFPAFGTYFYTLNCRPKFLDGRDNPLADSRVRSALALAIDRQMIVDSITRMGERPAANFIPVGVFPGYQSPAGPGLDVARARELLAAAGYPGGKGFPRISLLFNNEGQHAEIAQNVRKQWLDNLGIDIGLEGVEVKVFRPRIQTKDYAIGRASWFGDYMDPSTFTDKFLSYGENNDTGWGSADYDRLCDQAAVETDPAKRLADFEQAEAILSREMPIIPLYHYVNACLFRDDVKGIPLDPRNMVMLKAVEARR